MKKINSLVLIALISLIGFSKVFGQSEVEKKLILLEFQVKELKEQNEKLTERIIALELQLKGANSISNTRTESSLRTSSSTESKTLPEASTIQRCTAITQAGSQCKRSARSNGKCWQHGG